MQVASHFARSQRHTTHYLATGPIDGPLIIFVHGWPELSLSWRHQLPVFGGLGWFGALDRNRPRLGSLDGAGTAARGECGTHPLAGDSGRRRLARRGVACMKGKRRSQRRNGLQRSVVERGRRCGLSAAQY